MRPWLPAQHAFALAALRLLILFAVTFYISDVLAGLHPQRMRIHMGWELAIPYWPGAFVVYFSVFAVPFLPLWLVKDAGEIRCWEGRMVATLVVATVAFLILPAELAYVHGGAGPWWPLAELAKAVSGRYNLLPSLHVALSAVTIHAVWPHAKMGLRLLLGLWMAALVASVLFTHQHHVADALAGALLAWGVCRLPTKRCAAPTVPMPQPRIPEAPGARVRP